VGIALIIWMMSAILSALEKESRDKLLLFALSPLLLMFSFHFSMPAVIEARKAPGAFLQQFEKRINLNMPIVTDNNLIHLVCWTYQRDDIYLLDSKGELTYGLNYDDSKYRHLDMDGFNRLVEKTSPIAPVVLIGELHDIKKYWGPHLPPSVFKAVNKKFFYGEYRNPPPPPQQHKID